MALHGFEAIVLETSIADPIPAFEAIVTETSVADHVSAFKAPVPLVHTARLLEVPLTTTTRSRRIS